MANGIIKKEARQCLLEATFSAIFQAHKYLRHRYTTSRHNANFDYTSGRFLFNEKLRLAERHVRFNVAALHRAVEHAAGTQHGTVVDMRKLAEGAFNRTFIPFHIARPAYYTTASEAATLTLLRQQDIPVPKVVAYCAPADNPVGAEYILMSKASGVPLSSIWSSLDEGSIRRFAHSLVQLELKMFAISLPAYGSLYFREDLSNDEQIAFDSPNDQKFCIGPVCDYMFWPWSDHLEQVQSHAHREIAWLRKFGEPRQPGFPYNTFSFGTQEPQSHLNHLQDFLTLSQFLLPRDRTHALNKPTLRHPDLTASNTFVDPTTGRVTCLIDWQHTLIQPLLIAAGYPPVVSSPDEDYGPDLSAPGLPEAFDTMTDSEKDIALELQRRHIAFHAYRVFNGGLNHAHLTALRDPVLQLRQHLVDFSGQPWNGNPITMRSAIIRATQNWAYLCQDPDQPCPLHFEQSEIDEHFAREKEWLSCNIVMQSWRERCGGMNEEGWVRNEGYDMAKNELELLEQELKAECKEDEDDERAIAEGWPFRDHEELD